MQPLHATVVYDSLVFYLRHLCKSGRGPDGFQLLRQVVVSAAHRVRFSYFLGTSFGLLGFLGISCLLIYPDVFWIRWG
jgi:hypothetical protein